LRGKTSLDRSKIARGGEILRAKILCSGASSDRSGIVRNGRISRAVRIRLGIKTSRGSIGRGAGNLRIEISRIKASFRLGKVAWGGKILRGTETALYVKILRTVKNFQAEILDHAISHTAEFRPLLELHGGRALREAATLRRKISRAAKTLRSKIPLLAKAFCN